ncbi:hypothetical protein JCM18909_3933 [Cutibacterium acnes JCM 18909]|nr:hypothetical protein JCM18909_3933 [Cutibacterium acnes JCM 18909]
MLMCERLLRLRPAIVSPNDAQPARRDTATAAALGADPEVPRERDNRLIGGMHRFNDRVLLIGESRSVTNLG